MAALGQAPVLPGPPPDAVARVLQAAEEVPGTRPLSLWERVRVRAFGEKTPPSPPAPLPKGEGGPLLTLVERIGNMKRIARIAVAATVLAAIGISVSWIVIQGGSGNMAFARVADALDSLRSATYDVTSESKGKDGQPCGRATGKGFFLAPSHQRIENVNRKFPPPARRSRPLPRPRGAATLPTARRPKPLPNPWLRPSRSCPR